MPIYDDPRYIYDQPGLLYDGALSLPNTRFDGLQPESTGTLARRLQAKRSLTGDQLPASATLLGRHAFHSSVTGSQPGSTATLVRRWATYRALTGYEPSPAGDLSRLLHALVFVEGVQDEPTSTIQVTSRGYHRSLDGQQPEATALAQVTHHYFITLTGFQGAGGLSITYDHPGITYDEIGLWYEPSEAGHLERILHAIRAMEGEQPGATSDAEVLWRFSPYTWAVYQVTIEDTSEELAYVMTADPDQVLYSSTVSDEKIVYTAKGQLVYTRP